MLSGNGAQCTKGLPLPGWHTPGDRNLKSESRSVSRVRLFATPWTVSMEFSRPDRNPTSLIIAGFHLVAKCGPYSPDPGLCLKPMSVGKQSWKQSMQQNHNLSEQERQIISLYLSIKTSNNNQKIFFSYFLMFSWENKTAITDAVWSYYFVLQTVSSTF